MVMLGGKLMLAVLLLSIGMAEDCSSSLQVRNRHNNCGYSVKYFPEDTCKTPIFINCTVTSSQPSAALNLSFTDLKQCWAYCCEDNQSFLFCSNAKTTQQSTLMMVVAVVAGVIILGLVGTCYYRFHEEIGFCCRRVCCPRKKAVANSNNECQHNQTVYNLDQNQSNQWKQGSKLSTLEDCAVCLCAGPDLQLSCGHIFHRQCISECLKRKQECVLCRSKELFSFKLYCHLCYQRYRLIGERQLGKSTQVEPSCNECSDREEGKEEE